MGSGATILPENDRSNYEMGVCRVGRSLTIVNGAVKSVFGSVVSAQGCKLVAAPDEVSVPSCTIIGGSS